VNAYRWLAIASLLGAGMGCTSAPIRYYTLTPPADRAVSAGDAGWVVEVRVTHIPQPLQHSELVVRTTRSEVMLLENERWASPLKEEIKESLRLELLRRLPRIAGSSAEYTKLSLELDVQQLEAQIAQRTWLEASWRATLSPADPKSTGMRAATCTFHAGQQIPGGYDAIVEGYQRDIAALAEAIVVTLANLNTATLVACQATSP
jgi:uncharacterized lipoprotein YmbA